MRRLDAPKGLLAGIAIVLAVSGAILARDAWSRSGTPSGTLVLTERELAMPLSREKDDTGLELALVTTNRLPRAVVTAASWRRVTLPPFELPWLDAAKLRELGFDPDAILARIREEDADAALRVMPRRAYVVLEYDGPAWRTWLTSHATEGSGGVSLEAIDRTSRSRLMPIDAGPDREALRRAHADSERRVIVPAAIGIETEKGKDGRWILRGRIHAVRPDALHVPREWTPKLEPFLPGPESAERFERLRDPQAPSLPDPEPPRYRATVAFGKDGRPWLVSVESIEASSSER